MSNFSGISYDDDEVCFVLDQHAQLDFIVLALLKCKSQGRRHVAPLGHIILIPSQPVCSYSLMLHPQREKKQMPILKSLVNLQSLTITLSASIQNQSLSQCHCLTLISGMILDRNKQLKTIYSPFQKCHFGPVLTVSCNFRNFFFTEKKLNSVK